MKARSVSDVGKSASKVSKTKPRKDYPLFLHKSGQWCKKVKQKFHYFGTDPVEAEKEWDRVKDDLRAGRTPEARFSSDDTLTVEWLCNAFMDSRQARFNAGKIKSEESIRDYHKVVIRFADKIGRSTPLTRLKPRVLEDYANNLPGSWNITTRNNHLRQLRSVLKWVNESDELDRDIKYKNALELYREPQAVKDERHEDQFSTEELHTLIDLAKSKGKWQLVAAILLGVNVGFETEDIATVPEDAIDWETGWLNFSRKKTGCRRLAKLWPETLDALQRVLGKRPSPLNERHRGLIFLTSKGKPVLPDNKSSRDRPITRAFNRLKVEAGVHRPNIGQRSCRHRCRTLADEVCDRNAAAIVMGHKIHGIDGRYIDSISRERIQAVCDHVRARFFEGVK